MCPIKSTELGLVLKYVDPDTCLVREDLVWFFECDQGISGQELASKITVIIFVVLTAIHIIVFIAKLLRMVHMKPRGFINNASSFFYIPLSHPPPGHNLPFHPPPVTAILDTPLNVIRK